MPVGMYKAAGPFDQQGNLADYTDEINFIPNQWSRITDYGIFVPEGVTQSTIILDKVDDEIMLLPERKRGAPATVASGEKLSQTALVIPHIPHNDYLTPSDVQGRRRPGSQEPDIIERKRAKKMTLLRKKHAITKEFMLMSALKGQVMGGSGATLLDLYTLFGVTKKTVNFNLDTDSTNVASKCREVLRYVEDNVLNGGVIGGVRAVVSSEFFDLLIGHPKVEEAYKYYANGQQPLREDVRRMFSYQGILFEEYRGSAKLITGATQRFIASERGHAFPMGVDDMFKIYYAPADRMDYVNTEGQELYLFEYADPKGKYLEFLSESNPLPICTRPGALVELQAK